MATFTIFENETGPALKIAASELATLHLKEGSTLTAIFDGDDVVLKPIRRRKYSLQELLDQCDYSLPISAEDREWDEMKPVGREII